MVVCFALRQTDIKVIPLDVMSSGHVLTWSAMAEELSFLARVYKCSESLSRSLSFSANVWDCDGFHIVVKLNDAFMMEN